MRTIVHISDLHFGAADETIVSALASWIREVRPAVVAISGDLTQRARREQFAAAGRFLRELPAPHVVVPGNHDVPLYNVLARFGNPLGGFRRHVTHERFPAFEDDEIAVIGADTTRSFTIKDGGLRAADVRRLVELLQKHRPDVLKVIVCHHPFDPLKGRGGRLTMPAPDANAMGTLIENGADVFLTGHLHLSYTGHSTIRYRVHGRSAIVVEAGTATSTRARGEPNAFNVLRADGSRVTVERFAWDEQKRQFAPAHAEVFVRTGRGWSPPVVTRAARQNG